jgi:hypothetical protein
VVWIWEAVFWPEEWKYFAMYILLTHTDSCKALHNSGSRPGYQGGATEICLQLATVDARNKTLVITSPTRNTVIVSSRPDVTFSLDCHSYYNEIRKERLTQWTVGLIKLLAFTRRHSPRWDKKHIQPCFSIIFVLPQAKNDKLKKPCGYYCERCSRKAVTFTGTS